MPNYQIIPINAFNDNYIWLLFNPDTQKAICVDPGDAAPVFAALKQMQIELVGILVTHHHFDHTGGVNELSDHFNCPVYGPANEAKNCVSHPLSQDDSFSLKEFDLNFRVIEIPGHTLGHIAFHAEGILFCGDTLFCAGCGRVFEGTMEQMQQTLDKLKQLPDDTLIYCGHEYTENNLRFAQLVEPNNSVISKRLEDVSKLRSEGLASVPSSLSIEKTTNPFLRCDHADVKLAAEQYSHKTLNSITEVFTEIRNWKDSF